LEQRRSIEDVVGFKPSYEIVGNIMNLHKNIKVIAKRREQDRNDAQGERV